MKKFIIILDGAKGAGKTTTSLLLKERLKNTAFISLDLLRRLISTAETNDYYNEIAFKTLMKLSEEYLNNNINVVIDSGLKKERLESINNLAKKTNSSLYMFHLNAPKEILWERVQKRDLRKNKKSNKERFDFTYKATYEKDFSEFTKIDTINNNPEEVTNLIKLGLEE